MFYSLSQPKVACLVTNSQMCLRNCPTGEGAIGGIISQVTVSPLELLQQRLAVKQHLGEHKLLLIYVTHLENGDFVVSKGNLVLLHPLECI